MTPAEHQEGFAYESCDIPAGMTVREWRVRRDAEHSLALSSLSRFGRLLVRLGMADHPTSIH